MATKQISFTRPVVMRAEAGQPPKSFSITAYTGEPLAVAMYDMPVVLDLNATDVSQQRIPVLYDHVTDVDFVVGQTESVRIENGQILATGSLKSVGELAKKVIGLAAAGYVWQASIGADCRATKRINEGESVEVNGRAYQGPILVAEGVVLREISFVVLGADRRTAAVVARRKIKGSTMKPSFEEWLASLGFTLDKLDETQVANMRIMYASEYGTEDPNAEPVTAEGDPAPEEEPVTAEGETETEEEVVAEGETETEEPPVPAKRSKSKGKAPSMRAKLWREQAKAITRAEKIQALCARYGNPQYTDPATGRRESLAAHAIRAGWSLERAELHAIRAARPEVIQDYHGRASNPGSRAEILAAAAAQAGRLADIEKQYSVRTLEAAHKEFRSCISLGQLLIEAARMTGHHHRGVLRTNSDIEPVLRAAFSMREISGILSNVANKFLLQGYNSVENTWSFFAAKRTATDFKTITSYRMTGGFTFDRVGPDGTIAHATLGQQSFTNQVLTYAKMLAVTRQDLINDDMGAITSSPQRMGRGGHLKLNRVFWTVFLDNSSFFASGNNNVITGGTSALSVAGLDLGLAKFRKQTDPDGDPLGTEPKFLLVPPELEATAHEIFSSTNYGVGGGSSLARVPNQSYYANKFQPLVSAYLSNSSYTGYSATAWYLLGDALDVPVIEVAFLNGVETPTVETAEADFNTLGIQMRGVFDFGVSLQDHRGGVRASGTS